MNPEKFAFAVAAAIFAGGLIGLALQRILPEKHITGPSRDMIGAVVGLLTLLCALVTGLLIWTAYGVYCGPERRDPNSRVQGSATRSRSGRLRAGGGPPARAISTRREEKHRRGLGRQ